MQHRLQHIWKDIQTFIILGVQINFEGFFGGTSFVNPSKIICTPNNFNKSIYSILNSHDTISKEKKIEI